MLSINMSDVMNVVNSIKTYLIAMGASVLAAVVIQLAVSRLSKPTKRLIRGFAFIAALASICVCVNLICTGPMSTMLDLISGSGQIKTLPRPLLTSTDCRYTVFWETMVSCYDNQI